LKALKPYNVYLYTNMQNTTSENEILSSFSAVSITDEPISMRPKKGLSKTVSASQNVSGTPIKRPYESMPNLTAAAITIGSDTAAIMQTPTAVTIQQVFTEPIAFCPTPNSIGKLHRTTNLQTSDRGSRDPISVRIVWLAGFCRRIKPWWLGRIGREKPRSRRSSEKIVVFNAEHRTPLHG